MSLCFIKAWRNNKWYNKRVLIWRFTLVLIKINYGQIGDQTGLFYTINPVFYTSGNRFVHRTGTFGNLWFFHLSRRTTRNTRSTCSTSVFTGIGQALMSRPGSSIKFLHFVPFHHQIWPPRAILVFDWLLFKKIFSETAWQNGAKLGRKHIWKSKPGIDGPWVCPFQNCVRQPHPPFKMAAIF